MKKIEGVIKPHMLESVKSALHEIGVEGMTVTEVRGFGRQGGRDETYRGSPYRIDFLPKLKVELVLSDDLVDPAVSALVRSARTGRLGDGKIFVSDLSDVIRVRTGEHGEKAV